MTYFWNGFLFSFGLMFGLWTFGLLCSTVDFVFGKLQQTDLIVKIRRIVGADLF
jgi:hypothetical protein